MAVKRCEANIDVVKAAEIRIKNVFGNGLPVFFSFSGGKDSLCVAQLMVNLANRGEIDMKQLTVQFIDEEAIFPCMEDMTKKWRRIFMMMGAKFEWYCVEVKATADTITVLFLPETQNIQNHFVIPAEAIEKGMWTIRYSSDGMETVNVYEGSAEDGSESVAV